MLPQTGQFAKFWPFRVGITLLYGDLPGLERVTPTRLLLHTVEFATELGIDNKKLLPYLRNLEELGLIYDLDVRHGHCVLSLSVPSAWQNWVPEHSQNPLGD